MSVENYRSAVVDVIDSSDAGLGLHDRSGGVKIGLKGPGVFSWLDRHGFACPSQVYDLVRSGDDGLLVRVGQDEIIAESETGDDGLVTRIETLLAGDNQIAGVYRVEQALATLVLDGPNAACIWSQTCGINMLEQACDRIVYTRVAGISCGIIPTERDGQRAYHLWVDYSLAPALWGTLAKIGRELL